ncbi:MAG: hypothetical protein LBG99_02910 [Propionibacteriaceae bacterium]|nr:hypothetical protein [Propionibacteriaceae bacterium]
MSGRGSALGSKTVSNAQVPQDPVDVEEAEGGSNKDIPSKLSEHNGFTQFRRGILASVLLDAWQ